jgi:hypothetical protein
VNFKITYCKYHLLRRSQWPSGLRRGSTAGRLLGLRVRILPGAWMFVLCMWFSKDKRQETRTVRTREVQRSTKRERKRILPEAWRSVSCECCVLLGRSLCDGPITRPEESYRLWCVTVCDLEILRSRRPWPVLGCCARGRRKVHSDETAHKGMEKKYIFN